MELADACVPLHTGKPCLLSTCEPRPQATADELTSYTSYSVNPRLQSNLSSRIFCRLLYALWSCVALLLGLPRYLNHRQGAQKGSSALQRTRPRAAKPFARGLQALCEVADCPPLWWPQVRSVTCLAVLLAAPSTPLGSSVKQSNAPQSGQAWTRLGLVLFVQSCPAPRMLSSPGSPRC